MGDEIQGTSDPGFDAGSYVDQLERQAAEIERLKDRVYRLTTEREEERSSRQAWAEEAMRLQEFIQSKLSLYPSGPPVEVYDAPIFPTVCACVTDEQAAQLGRGFSRPVCAVHPTGWQPGDPVYREGRDYGICSSADCGVTWTPPGPESCPRCDAPALGPFDAPPASDFPCCEGGDTSP